MNRIIVWPLAVFLFVGFGAGHLQLRAQAIEWMDPYWVKGAKLESAEAVVIAIDTSGSIQVGDRLPREKTMAIGILNVLFAQNNRDPWLAVYSFDTDIHYVIEPTKLSRLNLADAIAAIMAIQDTGYFTWLSGAIDEACNVTRPVRPAGTLVLMTDGKPTTPDRNGSKDIAEATVAATASAQLFKDNCSTLAVIGFDVGDEDAEFLKKIASSGAFLSTFPPEAPQASMAFMDACEAFQNGQCLVIAGDVFQFEVHIEDGATPETKLASIYFRVFDASGALARSGEGVVIAEDVALIKIDTTGLAAGATNVEITADLLPSGKTITGTYSFVVAKSVTFDEAREIVISELVRPDEVQHPLIAFGWRTPLKQGDVVSTEYSGGPAFPIEQETWFFWLDDAPYKGFAHRTRYIFVHTETGLWDVHDVDWWPLLNGSSIWGTPEEYWNKENWIWSNMTPEHHSFRSYKPVTPVSYFASTSVFQPSGRPGGNPLNVRNRHLIIKGPDANGSMRLNARNWYGFARYRLGLSDDDIVYLTTDAADPGRDNTSTLENIRSVLDTLARTLTAGDYLTIYVTTHGAKNGDRILDGPDLSSHDLATRLGAFPPGVHVTVVIQGCFGGQLIRDLDDHPRVVDLIVTATDANNVSYSDIDNGNTDWDWRDSDYDWPTLEAATGTTLQLDPNPDDTGSEFSSGFIEQLARDARAFSIGGTYSWRDVLQRAFNHGRDMDSSFQNGELLEAYYADGESRPTPQFWRSPEALHRMASVIPQQRLERLYDLVGGTEKLRGNGTIDGRFSITINVDDGGTLRVVAIELMASYGYHVWDTIASNGRWAMGVADANDPQTLLNGPDTSVNIEVTGSRTLLLYCENDGTLWGPNSGGEFDLRITFSNGQMLRSMITLPCIQR